MVENRNVTITYLEKLACKVEIPIMVKYMRRVVLECIIEDSRYIE